jgi:hypothetical protein
LTAKKFVGRREHTRRLIGDELPAQTRVRKGIGRVEIVFGIPERLNPQT